MSDDTENTGETASQDDVDNMFGGDAAATDGDGAADDGKGGAMGLNQLEEGMSMEPEGREFEMGEAMADDVAAIYDIPVQISAVLGRSTMQVSQLLKLGRGAVVELDRKVGEAIDIYVNNRLVARGEVVVVDDKLGVTMTEIVKSDRS
jgi:flagellar motor switch protein FliN/FliY